MELSGNAKTVLERRYLCKDSQGNLVEDIPGMFMRVAGAIAAADSEFDPKADIAATADEFLRLMTELKFMPNSPTLMNAGKHLGQLSACFVLPIGDSMEEIFDAVKQAALIHKSGGGTGFSFSRLRAAGSTVNSTGGVASGPVSFMKVFNAATEAVKQGGTRRGANMGILRVDHPDILDFITCKQDSAEITNFNISIGLTEAFMRAARAGEEYDLIDPKTKQCAGKLNAGEVYEKIVSMAWKNGEPGIIFLDRLNKDNVVPDQGEIESTNPCGEQPLLPYESCNLGSINLSRFVKDGGLDFDELKKTVYTAVHFLDNVITVNKYPLPQIEQTTKSTRKIGLGVMGFADMLYMLGIPYNSDAGIEMGKKVMRFIQENAKQASYALAEQRGTFPLFDTSTLKDGKPIRNATVTTIAPTGTISIICNTSSGVEPVFALSYIRNVMDNDHLVETHPYFEQVLRERGLYSKELMQKIAQEGTLAHIDEIPEDIRRVFVTAHDVSPEYHIRMQAAFQEYTDNAVSKTVNFCSSATTEDVRRVYDLAFDLGCKGVTIYRDGSRDAQVLNIGKVNDGKEAPAPAPGNTIIPRPRPDVTQGVTQKIKIGCGNLYVTVNYDKNGICEVFTNLGRAGGCPSQSEATSRLVSMGLRSGLDVDVIIEQLRGIRCHSTIRRKDVKVLSCPDAIGRALETVAKMQKTLAAGECAACESVESNHDPITLQEPVALCPECGEILEHEGGCNICRKCGYSKCG